MFRTGFVFFVFRSSEAAAAAAAADDNRRLRFSSLFRISPSFSSHLGDLEHVSARAGKGEGPELLVPLHVLDFDLVVGRHSVWMRKLKEAKRRKKNGGRGRASKR